MTRVKSTVHEATEKAVARLTAKVAAKRLAMIQAAEDYANAQAELALAHDRLERIIDAKPDDC